MATLKGEKMRERERTRERPILPTADRAFFFFLSSVSQRVLVRMAEFSEGSSEAERRKCSAKC